MNRDMVKQIDDNMVLLAAPFCLNWDLTDELKGKRKILIQNRTTEITDFSLAEADRIEYLQDLEEVRMIGEGSFFSSEKGDMVYHKSKRGRISLAFCLGKEKDVIIPEGVNVIGKEAFRGSEVCSVKFPESLEEIRRGAFCNCIKLRGAKFGRNLENIEECVFSGCMKLEVLTFARSEKGKSLKIEDSAFAFCKNLRRVEFAEGLTVLGRCVFLYCYNLEEISVPDSVSEFEPLCLAPVKIIRVSRPLIGLAKAVATSDPRTKRMHYFFRITYKNKCIVVPACLYWRIDLVDRRIYDILSDDEKDGVYDLSDCAGTPIMRRQTALEAFRLGRNKETGAYLKGSWKELIDDVSADGKEESLIDLLIVFRDGGIQTPEFLKETVRIANKNGWLKAVALALQMTEEGERETDFVI